MSETAKLRRFLPSVQIAFFPSKEEGEKCIHGAAVITEVWRVRLCGVSVVEIQKLKSVTDLSGTDFSRMRSELERRGFQVIRGTNIYPTDLGES